MAHYGLEEEHLAAIGRVCVSWSVMDSTLSYLVSTLAGVDDVLDSSALTGPMKMGEKIEIARALGHQKLSPENFHGLDQLLNAIDGTLRTERNRIVHDDWSKAAKPAPINGVFHPDRSGHERSSSCGIADRQSRLLSYGRGYLRSTGPHEGRPASMARYILRAAEPASSLSRSYCKISQTPASTISGVTRTPACPVLDMDGFLCIQVYNLPQREREGGPSTTETRCRQDPSPACGRGRRA